MKKGSKKQSPKIYKGPDYIANDEGIDCVILGSPEYYSAQDLTAEIKAILEQFGFKLVDLFETRVWERGQEPTTYARKYDKGNLYRYFGEGKSSVIISNEALIDAITYMKKLGTCLKNPSDKNSFFIQVDVLSARIYRYCLENGVFSDSIQNYLGKQSVEKLLRFLKSIYVLQLSEEAWCYWLCYSTLNSENQREAKVVLLGCTGLLPNYDALFSLYFFNREEDIAFQHSVLTVEEKYKADEKKLQENLIKIALSHFEKFSDKVAIAERVREIMELDISLSPADWSVLLTYEYLCEKQKMKRAVNFVIAAVKEVENLQKGCTMELAKHFAKRFKKLVEEREEIELEQYLSENEETE